MIKDDDGGFLRGREDLRPGNHIRSFWRHLFKKYPCKTCLVQACCSEFCKESMIFRDSIIHWSMTRQYYRNLIRGIVPDIPTWICLGILIGICIAGLYIIYHEVRYAI